MTDENTTVETTEVETETVEAPIESTIPLKDIFNDSKSDDEDIPQVKEPEKSEAEPEGEKEPEQGTEPAAEPPAVEDEGTSVPLSALKEQRQKRQEVEDKLAQTEQKLAKYEQRAGDVPDPESDPIGYQEFLKDDAKVKVMNDRIIMSTHLMSETHKDYAEMEKLFLGMAAQNQLLGDRMKAHKTPALFAYQTAKAHHDKLEAQKVTANEELKTSIRNDIMKEFGIKQKPSEAQQRNESALSTPNLTGVTAKGSNSTPVEVFKFDTHKAFEDSCF